MPPNSRVDYDNIAPKYDQYRTLDPADLRDWLAHALDLMGLAPGARVLDLGCGTGRLTLPLLRRGYRAVGLDGSLGMLKQLKGKAPRCPLFQGDALHLPFRDLHFDGVIASFVLHHLADWRGALNEAARVGSSLSLITSDLSVGRDDILYEAFPGILEIDSKRFPAIEDLRHQLAALGYATIALRRPGTTRVQTREKFLQAVEHRFISTLDLLPPAEFERGLRWLRTELPRRCPEGVERKPRVVVLGGRSRTAA